MKKLLLLLLLSLLGASQVYSMEKVQNKTPENNSWCSMICKALAEYNQKNNTDYTFNDINHIKRTGLFDARYYFSWLLQQWNGYNTGQYLNINYRKNRLGGIIKNRKALAKHTTNFYQTAPEITVRKSRGRIDFYTTGDVKRTTMTQKEGVKVEIDTTEYDKDLLNRMPWYRKPLPLLSVAIPTTIGATWLFKSWWDSRK